MTLRSPARWTTRDIAETGAALAMALALHIIEAQLPSAPIPGVKLGLANVVTLAALPLWSFRRLWALTLLRVMVGSLFTGTFASLPFLFSLSGAVLSLLTMVITRRVLGRFARMPAISVMGAAAHNLGQLAVAWAVIGQPGVFYYLPYLLFISIPSGLLIGLLAERMADVFKSAQTPVRHTLSTSLQARKIVRLHWVDACAVVVLGVVGGTLLVSQSYASSSQPLYAVVRVNNEVQDRIPLDHAALHTLNVMDGAMTIEVADGKVRVKESTCPRHICVLRGWISRVKESIICMPYRTIITVETEQGTSGDSSGQGTPALPYDAVVG